MEQERKETMEQKPVVIQPDDIRIEIDDLLARKFTIKKEEKGNG
jgi:hypothetical protein